MSMPPPAKPIITMVKGREASARLTPKSVWMTGRATMIDHMPTPPMVDSTTATARRSHAAAELVGDPPWPAARCNEVMVMTNPAVKRPRS